MIWLPGGEDIPCIEAGGDIILPELLLLLLTPACERLFIVSSLCLDGLAVSDGLIDENPRGATLDCKRPGGGAPLRYLLSTRGTGGMTRL